MVEGTGREPLGRPGRDVDRVDPVVLRVGSAASTDHVGGVGRPVRALDLADHPVGSDLRPGRRHGVERADDEVRTRECVDEEASTVGRPDSGKAHIRDGKLQLRRRSVDPHHGGTEEVTFGAAGETDEDDATQREPTGGDGCARTIGRLGGRR